MTADVKHFYLNTPMDEPEYMKIPVRLIPYEIKVEYKVREFEHAGYVCVQIKKVMYGLEKAGLLASELLEKKVGETRIKSNATHPRPMETSHKAHTIRTSSGKFWHKVQE